MIRTLLLQSGQLLLQAVAWLAGVGLLVVLLRLLFIGLDWWTVGHARVPLEPQMVNAGLLCASVLAVILPALAALAKMKHRWRDAQVSAAERDGVLEVPANPLWVLVILALYAGGFTLFAAAAAFLIVAGKWVYVPLFIVPAVYVAARAADYLRQVLQPGPVLRLDPRGIDHAMFGLIPWEQVVGIHLESRVVKSFTDHVLHLAVKDPVRSIPRVPWTRSFVRRKWLRDPPRYGAVSMPLNILLGDAGVICAVARTLRGSHGGTFLPLWMPGIKMHELARLLDGDWSKPPAILRRHLKGVDLRIFSAPPTLDFRELAKGLDDQQALNLRQRLISMGMRVEGTAVHMPPISANRWPGRAAQIEHMLVMHGRTRRTKWMAILLIGGAVIALLAWAKLTQA